MKKKKKKGSLQVVSHHRLLTWVAGEGLTRRRASLSFVWGAYLLSFVPELEGAWAGSL